MPARVESAEHIAAGRFEPLRQNHFEIEIGDLGEDIQMTVVSVVIPKINIEVKEIPYLNEVRKYAGRVTYDVGDLVCRDYMGSGVAQKIDDWYKETFDAEDGQIGLCSAIKKEGTLSLLSPDMSVMRQWELRGIFPSNVAWTNASMESTDQVQITLTLSVDVAYPVQMTG